MSETTRAGHSRHTVARHANLPSPSRGGQILRFFAVALAVVLASGAGLVGYQTISAVAAFGGNTVDLGSDVVVPPDIGEIEGGVNVFIAGTDACEDDFADLFGERCTGADAEAVLNDVNLLMHISDEPRRVTVISFPRDLMLPIPECTDPETGYTSSAMSKQPLNSTFHYGGLACATKTVSELTGMSIPFAASVDWGGVIDITNAIGGVEVCIAGGIRDHHTGIDWPAGNRTLQGLEALQFLRTRHGVGNGGDLGRISNQQLYMSKLARKMVSDEVLSDVSKLYPLALTGLENVSASTTLSNPLTLMQIALAVKDVPFDEIVFVQYPVNADPADRNRVVPNTVAADALWAALEANQALILSGDPSQGDGVVIEEPTVEAGVDPTPEQSDEPTAEPTVPAGSVVLPSSIAGQTAAMDVCSNGNLR